MTTSKNKQTLTVERKEHNEKKEPYFKYTQELDSDLSIDNYKQRKRKKYSNRMRREQSGKGTYCNLIFEFLKHSKYKHNYYACFVPYHTALLAPSLAMTPSVFFFGSSHSVYPIQITFASSPITSFQHFPYYRNSIYQDANNFLLLTLNSIFSSFSPFNLTIDFRTIGHTSSLSLSLSSEFIRTSTKKCSSPQGSILHFSLHYQVLLRDFHRILQVLLVNIL